MGALDLIVLWLGKSLILLSRLFGRGGGSTFPGKVVRRLRPGLLSRLSSRSAEGNVLVTGTNGKTTTSTLLASISQAAGFRLSHNRSGANLISGITTSFVNNCGWLGGTTWDLGLIEVDEATVPQATFEARPRAILVTNFFRDQLDRYGELLHAVEHVRRGISLLEPNHWVILNADDPLAAGLGGFAKPQVLYYGIEDVEAGNLGPDGGQVQSADAKHCIRCGEKYQYEVVFYAHLGKYRCRRCGHSRPQPQVRLVELSSMGSRGTEIGVDLPAGLIRARLPIPGLYNVYNALAAMAAAHALGIHPEVIAGGVEDFFPSFGRMEPINLRGRQGFMALVKNPAGFNEVIRTVLAMPAARGLIISINDNYADGTDVSWLWDVDFERLAAVQDRFSFMIASGIRAEDMALRLKYAGVHPGRIEVVRDSEEALERALLQTREGDLFFILPTYTAMLDLRSRLERRGHVRRFWEM